MRLQGRRVYVTGATGFIGGVVTRRLVEQGALVTALVRPATPAGELERLGITVVRGNVTEPATLDMEGHDLAIHAAAWVGFGIPKHKLATFRATNVDGTRNVLAAAERAGVHKLVHVSSIAALGATTPGADETTPRADFYKSEYERTKTEAHDLALHAKVATALPMPGLVLGRGGPFDPLFQRIARGRLHVLPADDAVKGWVHVEDVASAILALLSHGTGPYLLVDENTRFTELVVAALEDAGLPIPRYRMRLKPWLPLVGAVQRGYHLMGKTPPVSEELLRSLHLAMSYDSGRARKELAWRPELTRRLSEDMAAYAKGWPEWV